MIAHKVINIIMSGIINSVITSI